MTQSLRDGKPSHIRDELPSLVEAIASNTDPVAAHQIAFQIGYVRGPIIGW